MAMSRPKSRTVARFLAMDPSPSTSGRPRSWPSCAPRRVTSTPVLQSSQPTSRVSSCFGTRRRRRAGQRVLRDHVAAAGEVLLPVLEDGATCTWDEEFPYTSVGRRGDAHLSLFEREARRAAEALSPELIVVLLPALFHLGRRLVPGRVARLRPGQRVPLLSLQLIASRDFGGERRGPAGRGGRAALVELGHRRDGPRVRGPHFLFPLFSSRRR